MSPIIAASPNFSEGRRPAVVAAIVEAMRAAGARLLEVHSDAELDRTVVQLAGSPERVHQAILEGASVAAARIDLGSQSGGHPRIGALDVVALSPVAGINLAATVELARELGRALAERLDLPVYLYAEAALRPERIALEAVRAGQYEGLREAIEGDPARAPDFGPARMGPAGAVAVGARPWPLRLRLSLSGGDRAAAEALARALDGDTGGLTAVRAALEPALPPAAGGASGAPGGAGGASGAPGDAAAAPAEPPAAPEPGAPAIDILVGRADLTPLPRVMDLARGEAARQGLAIAAWQLEGFVPQALVIEAARHGGAFPGLRAEQVIESQLIGEAVVRPAPEAGLAAFAAAVASDDATPGGGSVAAAVAALAAALAGMVAGLTLGRPKYAAAEARMRELRAASEACRETLLALAASDSAAFESVMAAYRLPRGTAAEGAARRAAIQAALERATENPLAVIDQSIAVLGLLQTAAEQGEASTISDAGVAGWLALAAAQGAALNVEINAMGLRDLEAGDRCRRAAAEGLREARQRADTLERLVRARLAGST